MAFDQESARKVPEQDAEALRSKLAELDAKFAAIQFTPAARVAEVHMSRYTIEWTGSPLPEGALLYACGSSAMTDRVLDLPKDGDMQKCLRCGKDASTLAGNAPNAATTICLGTTRKG